MVLFCDLLYCFDSLHLIAVVVMFCLRLPRLVGVALGLFVWFGFVVLGGLFCCVLLV